MVGATMTAKPLSNSPAWLTVRASSALAGGLCLLVLAGCGSSSDSTPTAAAVPAQSLSARPVAAESITEDPPAETPWDYSPYRVLIWFSSDDPWITAESVEAELRTFLERDFAAVWRTEIAAAPTAVGSLAARQMHDLDYNAIVASDPVLAVKRDHPEAVRIRTAANVGEFCKSIYVSEDRKQSISQRSLPPGDATDTRVAEKLEVVEGDEFQVSQRWSEESTEAILVSRGIATGLTEPEAKLISPQVDDLISAGLEDFDKVFVVHLFADRSGRRIDAVELDVLMRHFGPVVSVPLQSIRDTSQAIGRAVTMAFAPLVRAETAGVREVTGLLRAGGLIIDPKSPANVTVGDALEPMVRKNDRNGDPIVIGRMDWATLLTTKAEGRYLTMDFYAGRRGSMQGRKNNRTFRMGLKARPQYDSTQLRLHLQRNPKFPLIGYELYERQIDSREFTFVGRTDWDGRVTIDKSDSQLRLLYVKNGGSVLARLPLIPGLYPTAVADLSGDDIRLQAEAYVRGAQNKITDLVARRELFKSRIRKALEKGDTKAAEDMMLELRKLPNGEELSTAIGTKQTEILQAIGRSNAGQRKKVDEMFSTTRELVLKFISPKLIRELEQDFATAQANGGKLPAEGEEGNPQAVAPQPPANPLSQRNRPEINPKINDTFRQTPPFNEREKNI
jgi:hypothetical protein